MNWSAMLLLSAGLAAPQTHTKPSQFESYTKAYHTASVAHKPMLVVLNPSADGTVFLEELRSDPELATLLDGYIIAVVNCGTEHGQQVHKAFGSKQLPYISVIDEEQDKQVFNSSEKLSTARLRSVLKKYKDGAKAASIAERIRLDNDCPLCRRNQTSF